MIKRNLLRFHFVRDMRLWMTMDPAQCYLDFTADIVDLDESPIVSKERMHTLRLASLDVFNDIIPELRSFGLGAFNLDAEMESVTVLGGWDVVTAHKLTLKEIG